jgi:hypothetical protein
MTTTTTNSNGRTRKSLAEQIDRLDAILGGLSEALEGAVAAAVKEAAGRAVREAVQAVLAEVPTNPAFRKRALSAERPPAPRADSPPYRGRWPGWRPGWARGRGPVSRRAPPGFAGSATRRSGSPCGPGAGCRLPCLRPAPWRRTSPTSLAGGWPT